MSEKNIRYETKEKSKWYEIDRFDILVNDRKFDIKCNFISNDTALNWGLSPMNQNSLLDCSALVPTNQLHSRTLADDDIYIFAYTVGSLKSLDGFDPKASLFRNTIDGKWVLHGFWDFEFLKPKKWLEKHNDEPLGKIYIESSSGNDAGKRLRLGGTRWKKEFAFEEVTLNHNGKAVTDQSFFQLFFLRLLDNRIPDGVISVSAKDSYAKEIIRPFGGFASIRKKKVIKLLQNDWDDIWIYGNDIYYAGYLTKGEFKEISEELERFDKSVKQFELQTDNNRCFVSELRPMRDIL